MRSVLFSLYLFLPISLFSKPNVLVFLTDDQGWGDLSINGNSNLETPNLDSIARGGASFDRFFVCPVCSPTRAEFLTGRHHVRSGVYDTSAGGERMDLDEITIADLFQKAGYATGAFGKWHNGMQFPYHPLGRGFDYFYGFCSGHWGQYYDALMERNGELVEGQGYCVDDFTMEAMNFIERSVKKDKPFFAYVPYNTPHSPMQVPDRWWNKFKDRELEKMMRSRRPKKEDRLHLLAALAMCENIDWNVGRLLKKLDNLKVADDTIVVFFHDNGPNGTRWNGDMEGRKGSTEEGGTRSPLFVKWPKVIKPGIEIVEISSVLDLLPTLVELTGIKNNSDKLLDGKSLKPLLVGNRKEWKPRTLISNWKNKVGARNQRFRLDYKGRLYDMRNDPGQRTMVNQEFPAVFEGMQEVVDQFRTDIMGELGKDERPFVIGHPDVTWSQVPARDGTAYGGIKRSNKFRNCSYFLNWKSTDDFISWDIELSQSGIYEVELWYACPRKDLGAEILLSFNGKSLKSKIVRGVDLPLLKGFDRKPRMEGYVKKFEPMIMGQVQLTKGSGQLKLEALKIPKDQAMEFRLLMFRRIETLEI
ncbi:MAG: arylsulfatase [Opitutales bacterium]|nr:arylsulfatase [Opitutales bacterium]